MTTHSKNTTVQSLWPLGGSRAFYGIGGPALLFSLICGSTPTWAGSLTPDLLLQNPTRFDNNQVTVSGTVSDIQNRVSHRGRALTLVSLCGSSRCLTVFIRGRHFYQKNERLSVTGTFSTLKRVGSHLFKNEIMGTSILPVVTVPAKKSLSPSPGSRRTPPFLQEGRADPFEPNMLKRSDQILIQQQNPEFHSSVDTPDYAFPPDPRKYAVVIGIESYQSLPRADFARRDARDVYRHLVALGYEKQHIRYLRDAQATKSLLKGMFEEWLPTNVNAHPGAEVFVYFSGHGAPGIESHQAYLIPWDGNPAFLKTTGFSLATLYSDLGHLKGEVLVALDSCFSGAGGRSVLPKGIRPLVTRIETPPIASFSNLTVLAASRANEISTSDERHGHGTFTYYLLKDLNRTKGKSSAEELYRYVKTKVEDAARLQNVTQTPQLFGSGSDRF